MASLQPAYRNVIVLGASMEGTEAVMHIVAALGAAFAGALLIVQHVPANHVSMLAQRLNRLGTLHAAHARDGEPLEPGRIYIAPADDHMLVQEGRVLVRHGPKENRFRPSIDALFRSAAFEYGPRVVGAILSGALNDGASGLWSIKKRGGTIVVQAPDDPLLLVPPLIALHRVDVDYATPAAEMGALLTRLARSFAPDWPHPSRDASIEIETRIAAGANAFEVGSVTLGEPSMLTCPECGGVLFGLRNEGVARFRCHTGHAYSLNALLASLTESVEENLVRVKRALEESVMLLEQLSGHFAEAHEHEMAQVFAEKARMTRSRSENIDTAILQHEQFSVDTITHPGSDRPRLPNAAPSAPPLSD